MTLSIRNLESSLDERPVFKVLQGWMYSIVSCLSLEGLGLEKRSLC